MGIGMAGNLSKVATSVVCFDPTPAAREAAEQEWVRVRVQELECKNLSVA